MTGTVACDFRMARAERLEGCVEGVDLVRAWIVRKEMPEDSRRVIRSVVCCDGGVSGCMDTEEEDETYVC